MRVFVANVSSILGGRSLKREGLGTDVSPGEKMWFEVCGRVLPGGEEGGRPPKS